MIPKPTPPSDTPITDAVIREVLAMGPNYPFYAIEAALKNHARTLERAARRLAEAMAAYRSACGNTGYIVPPKTFEELYEQAGPALAEWRKLEAGQ